MLIFHWNPSAQLVLGLVCCSWRIIKPVDQCHRLADGCLFHEPQLWIEKEGSLDLSSKTEPALSAIGYISQLICSFQKETGNVSQKWVGNTTGQVRR